MAELVVVADAGVVAGGVQGHGDFGHGERVGQGDECVEGVARRAAVALVKAQAGGHHGAQAGKVAGGGGAFEATQALKAAGLGQFALLFAQLAQGLRERVARLGVVLAQGFKPFALRRDFAVDERAGVAQAKTGVQAQAGLGHAAGGVVVRAAQQQAGAALAPGQEQQANAVLAQVAQQAGLQRDLAAQDDAGDGRQWHGGAALAVFVKGDGACIVLQVYVAAVNIQAGHGGGSLFARCQVTLKNGVLKVLARPRQRRRMRGSRAMSCRRSACASSRRPMSARMRCSSAGVTQISGTDFCPATR